MTKFTAKDCVSQDVFCNLTKMMEELLRHEGASEEQWYRDLFEQVISEEDWNERRDVIDREPLTFWAVSDRLAVFLKLEDEAVTKEFDTWVWGRETFGQPIECDGVIERFVDYINEAQ